ncbi:hypothetical protein DL546_009022 [Coniochaeta pulveracea]|uniref:Uncharacterized protein n=1 Tax=Coniochaeta pulveracea TaxID=177199 RepID=A0A420YKH2_9PEZI|nr:hypothetical protein DL546_009022 [Coniochaeta pulveracea]
MHGKPVDQLVHQYMFPNPQGTDPATFEEFQQQLIREVRSEVMAFYGHLDTPEAKFPGLDYSHPTHRIRLSRYKWHRRLFRAFDALGLTPNEIASLTKWEGTKWAKDKYEKEQGVTIQDTTEAEFTPRLPLRERRTRAALQSSEEPEEKGSDTVGDDSDEELASVGVHLNERLRERVALRNVSGDLSTILDEEWEQWLKNVIERASIPTPSVNPDTLPPRLVAAARNGQWGHIPDFLRPMLERVLDSEAPVPPPQSDASDLAQGTARRANRVRRGGRAFERARRIAGSMSQPPEQAPTSQFNDIYERGLFLDAQLEAARAQVAELRARRYTPTQGSD